MNNYIENQEEKGLTDNQIREILWKTLEGRNLEKVLIIPPDFTRQHSNAGFITNVLYHTLRSRGCTVDILLAQGTHEDISKEQFRLMYGDIPYEVMIPHRWREDTVSIGTVPSAYVREVTENLWSDELIVEVNKRVLGLEKIMGKDYSAVRRVFDYALEHFLREIPLLFILTVTTASENQIHTHGIYIGDERKVLEEAIVMSQKKILTFWTKALKSV